MQQLITRTQSYLEPLNKSPEPSWVEFPLLTNFQLTMTVHRGWVPFLTLKATKGHHKDVHMASSLLPDHHFGWQIQGEGAGEAAAGWAEGAKWVLVTQSGPTLCNHMDCSPPGSSVHGDSPGRNTGVSSHALLQGIFLTQGLSRFFTIWATREEGARRCSILFCFQEDFVQNRGGPQPTWDTCPPTMR